VTGGAGQRAIRAARLAIGAARQPCDDVVVVEEPLEVRIGEERLLVTMRTPGDDFDLVRGLLYTEGLIERGEDLIALARCDAVAEHERDNVVVATLDPRIDVAPFVTRRAAVMHAGCGVCGRRSLEDLAVTTAPIVADWQIAADVLFALPQALIGAQTNFATTGGLHAAGLFDRGGRRLALREDVGRHNAVDKVIGEALRYGLLPLSDAILVVSGRAGFEIAQKARRAGIPLLASVSAPSSLAIDVCAAGGMTLVGFLRDGRANLYCGESRIAARPATTESAP
jgi:FdhD protein